MPRFGAKGGFARKQKVGFRKLTGRKINTGAHRRFLTLAAVKHGAIYIAKN